MLKDVHALYISVILLKINISFDVDIYFDNVRYNYNVAIVYNVYIKYDVAYVEYNEITFEFQAYTVGNAY